MVLKLLAAPLLVVLAVLAIPVRAITGGQSAIRGRVQLQDAPRDLEAGFFALDDAVSGRVVTVWLTSLPSIGGECRGAIAEVVVKG